MWVGIEVQKLKSRFNIIVYYDVKLKGFDTGTQLRIQVMWGAMLHHWVSGSLHFVLSFSWVIQSSVTLLGLLDSRDEGTWNISSSLPTDVASHCRITGTSVAHYLLMWHHIAE
jgi:hypothetical protein